MATFLFGLLLGTLGTWLIAVRVVGKPFSEQKDLYDKLHPEVRCTLLADSRRHLTASDLRELLGPPRDAPGGRVLQQTCPECGTDRLYYGKDYAVDFAVGADGKPHPTALSQDTVECEECGWKVMASSETNPQDREG